jgi:septal ring factor EnvC (AmiA/AmiB activator)
MTQEKRIAQLEQENAELRAQLAEDYQQISQLAERLQRVEGQLVIVQQKISGTFRSEDGATAFCRIRSYLSTMRKQGYAMLAVLAAVFAGRPLHIARAPKKL